MKTNNILLALMLIVTSLQLKAQDNSFCGTEMTPEEKKAYLKRLSSLKMTEKTIFNTINNLETKYIPIKAHIGRTSNGEGALSIQKLNDAIRTMNNDFAPINFEFYLCDGINYIDNDELFDFKKEDDNILSETYNIPNLINIYFFRSVKNNSGRNICGYANFPKEGEYKSNHIVMKNDCAKNRSTLTHEMGHYYNLLHTHETSYGEELVDGSNCGGRGDLICDTPADPRLRDSNVNKNCVYIGDSKDANGDTYKPDPKNIMSYSRKACRTVFTNQQFARMRAASELNSRKHYRCMLSNSIETNIITNCNGFDVELKSTGIGATSWAWDIDSDGVTDYTIQNPTHTFPNGKYNVTLTVSNGKESITKTHEINIKYTNKINGSVKLELFTGNNSKDISWEFREDNGTVLYSSPKYTKSDDNTVTPFNYIFDVKSNECYTFEILDAAGNGLEGGNYSLLSGDNILKKGSKNYKFGEKTTFSVGQAAKLKLIDTKIDYDQNGCTDALDVFFKVKTEGATSWEWDIDNDGIIDYYTRKFKHTYTVPDNYTVKLNISDGVETITKTFENAVTFEKADAITSSEYLTLSLLTDRYSAETSWTFKKTDGEVIESRNNYNPYYDNNRLFIYKIKLKEDSNCYEFSIYDSFGDGICCSAGAGSYDLRDSDGNVIVEGGDFGSSETFKIYNNQNGTAIVQIERRTQTVEREDKIVQPISIYPNPTQSILYIKGDVVTDSYTILDINGRVLDSGNATNNAINVQKLSAGVYFLRIDNTTQRFIKE